MLLDVQIRRFHRHALWSWSPILALVSLSDAAVLGGLRLFLGIFDPDLRVWKAGGVWSFPAGQQMALWAGFMLFLVALRFVTALWRQDRVERMVRQVEAFLRVWLRQRLRHLPTTWYHKVDAEDRLRAAEESSRVLVSAMEAYAQAFQAVLQLAIFIPVLFWIRWPLAVGLLLGMLPLMAWIQNRLRRLTRRMDGRLQDQGRFDSTLSLWGFLVRHWTLEADLRRMERDLGEETRRLRDEGFRLGLRKSVVVQVADMVAALAVIVVLVVCGIWMGQGIMGASELVLFAAALLLCYKPLKDCLRVLPILRESQAALHNLVELQKPHPPKSTSFPHQWIRTTDPIGIKIRDLTFTYQGSSPVQVFSGLSLSLSADRPIWLRGANGCGKTTLLRILAGLEEPSSGSVCWHPRLPHPAGFLSHRADLPPVRVMDASLLQKSQTPARQRLLDLLDVRSLLDRDNLSAGQRQRLGLAWLFCSGAKVLFLDEPFAFISAESRQPILEALLECARADRLWFVMANHDPLEESQAQQMEEIEINDQNWGTHGKYVSCR